MPEKMMDIDYIRTKKGTNFLDGARSAINNIARIKEGEKVLIAGTKSHEPFLRALHHFAEKIVGKDAKLVIEEHVKDETEEQERMAQAAREHGADVFLFALNDDPEIIDGRFAIYDATKEANKDVFTITMPGISEKAVSDYLPTDAYEVKKRSQTVARKLRTLRGKKFEIHTFGPRGEKYVLRGRLPDKADEERFKSHAEKDEDGQPKKIFKIVADDMMRRKGEVINLPAGEAFCQPMEVEGKALLAPGTILMDHGVVQSGVIIKIKHDSAAGFSRVTDVAAHDEADEELVQKLLKHIDTTLPEGKDLENLKAKLHKQLKRTLKTEPTDDQLKKALEDEFKKIKNRNAVAELGIAVNKAIRNADNNLEGEKESGTAHLGIGHNYKHYGIISSNQHGDIIFRDGKLYINKELFVDMTNRNIPLIDDGAM